jgi:hypothetical protein
MPVVLHLQVSLGTLKPMTKALAILLAGTAVFAADSRSLSDQYAPAAQKLIGAAMSDDQALARLEYLCDRIGNRLSGTASLERAIQWSADEMRKAGLANVQTPPVMVPHWVRGRESATLLAPVEKPLTMIGLGMSVGTPAEGITGDVVLAHTFDELKALGRAKVEGKIVLFNPEWKGYGQTVMYRVSGASKAADLGAKAVLVRSMTGVSLQTPHTGALEYAEGSGKIPAAALSTEDAAMLDRLIQAGVPVRVKLAMEAHQEPDAQSHNVMGEIVGSEKPDEVVVLGGHVDSWDVGQGANDDGSGILASLEAVALIKKLGLRPRRTIRVVFWVSEENSGAGGVAYRKLLGDAVSKHVAAIEMDGGAEKSVGFGFGSFGGRRRAMATPAPEGGEIPPTSPAAFDRVVAIGNLLESIEGGQISHGGGGSDIEPLMLSGVPGLGVRTVEAHYFDWHHTDADSFDKLVLKEFQANVASLAVMSYVLADMPERLSEMK